LHVRENKTVTIGFSAIGFQSKRLTLHVVSDTVMAIVLFRTTIKLNEVVIVNDYANVLLNNMLKKYGESDTKREINVNSYMRLFSSAKGVTYENLEAVYSSLVSVRKMQKLQVENGRYGLIDSFRQKNLVFSADFSKLISHLNLFNYETNQQANYPWFPLFNKKREKYVQVKLEGMESASDGIVAHISILPLAMYDDRFFATHVWINTRTFNLEKVSAFIDDPLESPIYMPDKSKLQLQGIRLTLLFDSFGDSLSTYPKYYSVKLNYTIPAKDSIRVITSVQFINYTKNHFRQPMTEQEYESDYGLIQNTLYLRDWWDKNIILEKTKQEYEVNELFNNLNYFDNSFSTQKDTDNFLSKGFSLCSYQDKSNYKISKLEDASTVLRTDSFFLVKLQHDTLIRIAALYFDICFLYACYDETFSYVCLPLFDYRSSWVNAEDKNSMEIETLTKLMAKLTYVCSRKLEQEIQGLKDPCSKRADIERIKQKNLALFDSQKNELVLDTWKKGEFLKWEKKLAAELAEMEIHKE
jgi:hypothetical protein